MSYQLFVRPEVDADIAEGELWYEQRLEGLGKDFTRTVRDEMRRLPENALLYRVRHRRLGVRWFYPPRFPYRIVYRVQGEVVVVLAVLHAAQHDRHWKERARQP